MLSAGKIGSVIQQAIRQECQGAHPSRVEECEKSVEGRLEGEIDQLCREASPELEVDISYCRGSLESLLWRGPQDLREKLEEDLKKDLIDVADSVEGTHALNNLKTYIELEANNFKAPLPPPPPPPPTEPESKPERQPKRRVKERPDLGVIIKEVLPPDAGLPDQGTPPAKEKEPDAGAKAAAETKQPPASPPPPPPPPPPPEERGLWDQFAHWIDQNPKGKWIVAGAAALLTGGLLFTGGRLLLLRKNRSDELGPLPPLKGPDTWDGEPSSRGAKTNFGEQRTVLRAADTPPPPPAAEPRSLSHPTALASHISAWSMNNLAKKVPDDVADIAARLISNKYVSQASPGNASGADVAHTLLIRAEVMAEVKTPGTQTITVEVIGEAFKEIFGPRFKQHHINPDVLTGILAQEGIHLSPAASAAIDDVTVRVNLADHPEFESLDPTEQQRVCEAIAEKIRGMDPEERRIIFDGGRLEEESRDILLKAAIRNRASSKGKGGPPEGPKGKGPTDPPSPPSAPKPPAAAAKGGEAPKGKAAKKKFANLFPDDPDSSERRAAALEKYGGFFNITFILGAIETAKHFGWIGEKQYKMTHDGVTAAFFIADAGFLAAMAAGGPGAVAGGAAACAAAEATGIPWLKRDTLGHKLVCLGGGVGGFTAFLNFANRFGKYREFQAATAAGTREAARQASQVIGRAGAAIEGGLAGAWQGFATGLRMYGREFAAVALVHAAAIQTGARVFFAAGARFATPLFIVGDINDILYPPSDGQNNRI